MKIGYPCINRSVGCTPNRTFRLASYSEERLVKTVQQNLDCLRRTLDFNFRNRLLFFRIGSGLIPFASHPVCRFDWRDRFKEEFRDIGSYLRKHRFRVGMHPDQFVLINAIKPDIVRKSVKELAYHCDVLDLLGLDQKAKVQIHAGGAYGDKKASLKRFVHAYRGLPARIKKRLVVENDHLSYSLRDCLLISEQTGVPVVLDVFHHECLNNGEDTRKAVTLAMATWKKKADGRPMVDYSSQKSSASRGSHAEGIDTEKFKDFLSQVKGLDFDLMLEIKDKEKSALKAIRLIGEPWERKSR